MEKVLSEQKISIKCFARGKYIHSFLDNVWLVRQKRFILAHHNSRRSMSKGSAKVKLSIRARLVSHRQLKDLRRRSSAEQIG